MSSMNEQQSQHHPTPPDPATRARHTEAERLAERGRAALLGGDQAAADRLLAEAVALYESIGDGYCVAAQTGNYGWTLRRAGQPEQARPYLQRAAERFAALGLHDFAERHRSAAEEGDTPLNASLLAGLPPAVRGALERNDLASLEFAINSLPLAQQQVVFQRLQEAGVISDAASDDTAEEAVQQFDVLLRDIAAVALGDPTYRAEIEVALADLERKGWNLRGAVQAIWGGQRDPARLTAGLDAVDARLVRRILELIAGSGPDKVTG